MPSDGVNPWVGAIGTGLAPVRTPTSHLLVSPEEMCRRGACALAPLVGAGSPIARRVLKLALMELAPAHDLALASIHNHHPMPEISPISAAILS